jgi:hypothetical protein
MVVMPWAQFWQSSDHGIHFWIEGSRNSNSLQCNIDTRQASLSTHCSCQATRFRLENHHHVYNASWLTQRSQQCPHMQNALSKSLCGQHMILQPVCSMPYGNAGTPCPRTRSPMSDLQQVRAPYTTLFPCPQTLAVSFGCIYLMACLIIQRFLKM